MIAVPDDRTRFGDSLRERPGSIVWPVIPGEAGTMMLALQFKFEESEYWPPEQMREHQLRQVASLAAYAHEFSPFWRRRLDRAGYRRHADATPWFDALVPLTRAEAQGAGRALWVEPVPPEHGAIQVGKTSGSTGPESPRGLRATCPRGMGEDAVIFRPLSAYASDRSHV